MDSGPPDSRLKEQHFYALGALARAALNAGRWEEAEALANELLSLAPAYVGNWNYGNALHQGHLILGHVALERGDVSGACEQLLASAKTPGSPQLVSLGPTLTLAQALLEQNQREVVVDYLQQCHVFWSAGHGRLDTWTNEVREGGTPVFFSSFGY